MYVIATNEDEKVGEDKALAERNVINVTATPLNTVTSFISKIDPIIAFLITIVGSIAAILAWFGISNWQDVSEQKYDEGKPLEAEVTINDARHADKDSAFRPTNTRTQRMVLPSNSIFISYRKDDSAGWSAKLADDLRSIMRDYAVFIDDSTSIPFGTQWPDQISVALDQCRVFLPVNAPSWHQATSIIRLKEPGDWVRRELITTHTRRSSVLCIPVFVNEPPVLDSEQFFDDSELQQVIADLMTDQGIRLDRGTELWPAKIDSLISRITTHLGITFQQLDNESETSTGKTVHVEG